MKRDIDWNKEVANDYEEYLETVVVQPHDRDWNPVPWREDPRRDVSQLDYVGEECCGDWCGCGESAGNLGIWIDWLRIQAVYPPKPLANPVFPKDLLVA